VNSHARYDGWDELMRASLDGNETAYRRLLNSLVPALRATVRMGYARFGVEPNDVEDVVQETLLAIHLKRHTWKVGMPVAPWVMAIARNKLIDVLRRRWRGVHIPMDAVVDAPEMASPEPDMDRHDVLALMNGLKPREREVVYSIAIEEFSIQDVAGRLAMSEGAVRVAFHRSLKKLAALYRKGNGER
jgi:RNA polymerase sigma-70 factor (ECF subfamily)